MKESLINFIINIKINKNLLALIISMMPVLEIRGALPISVFLLKIPILKSFILCTFGNAFIVLPFMMILKNFQIFNKTRNFFVKKLKIKFVSSIFDWWIRKTKKNENLINKYGAFGLLIFVAIPLPTTGAYTAVLLAHLLKIKIIKAFIYIFSGVIIAGFITLIFTKGIILI